MPSPSRSPDPALTWSEAALLHEALVAPRSALVPMPDTVVEERAGWHSVRTPSMRLGGLNEVFHAELDESEVEAVIDDTLARYAADDIRFRWTLGPGTKPGDLGERLARRGLIPTVSRVMWRSTRLERGPFSEPKGDHPIVSEAVDAPGLDAFTRVIAEGWSLEPGALDAYHERCLGHPARRHRFFVARSGAVPIGAAGSLALERSAYLIGGVVVARARGLGAYRALVEARLARAAADGLAIATSIARDSTAAPILARLGFTTLAKVTSFSNR